MLLQEHLLSILIEECAEASKIASKSIRMGLRNTQKGEYHTNAEKITQQFSELYAVLRVLHQQNLIPQITQSISIDIKVREIYTELNELMESGTLTE